MEERSQDSQDDRGGDRSRTPTQSGGTTSADSTEGGPAIALPKGGGAVRGIGEKFAANPVNGTGSLTIPLATSPGRSGLNPQLQISYDSGNGNSAFGFGWRLSLPAITRKTDKGLPQYQEALESDVFLLSGVEDLVPEYKQDAAGQWLQPDGEYVIDENERTLPDGSTYSVRRYRPRIEGLFARIERWSNVQDPADVHWQSLSKENVLTLYGKDESSRIQDPMDPRRIFSWLICETRDDKGNAVVYEYKPDDGAGVVHSRAHERNRGESDDPRRTANRYLKRIHYGNRTTLLDQDGQRPPFLEAGAVQTTDWMFEVVLDYGEHHPDAPKPNDAGDWAFRADPFSTYRAGFEVRTTRLCQRALVFHHFAEEANVERDCLVRSTDLTYSHEQDPTSSRVPVYTFLKRVTQCGYVREGSGYLKRDLPSVELDYTAPVVRDEVEGVDIESVRNLPIGVDGSLYRWTDVHGEGIPGVLTEHSDAWSYKRNLSPLHGDAVELGPAERVAVSPNASLAAGAHFMDLAGDGQPDLVILDGPTPGFYEHDDEEGWQPFRAFSHRLERDTRDPNLRWVDLSGDGHADVLVVEDGALVWHPSLAEGGFDAARRAVQSWEEEEGPRLVFADGTESIFVGDASGDGLADLIRIRNGEVSYWPNLGYGRFGAKVAMDDAPWFDNPDQFEPGRVRLADIDGSGTVDLIYLHREGVRLYFNQSGNSWSAPVILRAFPKIDDVVRIATTDLLGNGTACLVWSASLPDAASRPMRYVNLMGGVKPHLLVRVANNLGAETRVSYAPSTKFYLQDKRAGKPWITRLPFPVHVVERVETLDHISGNRFVARYAYHHGYFDGEEREFRGFGMVEQWDTEEFHSLSNEEPHGEATNLDPAFHVPPALTKTWFHTGAYLGGDRVSGYFAGIGKGDGEYYRRPSLRGDDQHDAAAAALLLPDTVLPEGLSADETREAVRALKGSMLRQEVYALDGTDREEHPYTITKQSFTIRPLQPRGGNRYGVYSTHAREAVNDAYERNPEDPRTSHTLTLEVDDYGNVLREAAIAYGRHPDSQAPSLTAAEWAQQARTWITYTENRFTNGVTEDDHYRVPLPAESRTYELTGYLPEGDADRFSFDEWTRDGFDLPARAAEIPYEASAGGVDEEKRLIEHVRILYRRDDLTAVLPLGELQPLALPWQSYKLALTSSLVASVFQRKQLDLAGEPEEALLPDPSDVLEGGGADRGGYVVFDDSWWVPSGRGFFDPDADSLDPAGTAGQELDTAREGFFQVRKSVDPFGHSSYLDYDEHHLLLESMRDALDSTVTAVNDYRVLQPSLVIGPNGNRTGAAFDAFGLVVATAVMGKEGEDQGDLLESEDLDLNPPLEAIQAFVADPRGEAATFLGTATTRTVYDLDRFARTGQPALAATLVRETHLYDPGGDSTKVQIAFTYSDGFQREIQRKVQAEAGLAPGRAPDVALPSGDLQPGELLPPPEVHTDHRWVGSGRTVFNNKGKPTKQYEPFFSATHLYEPEREITDAGVTPVLFYDPLTRVIATLHPNHTYEKVVFDAWQQTSYDTNDTVAAFGDETGDPRTDLDIAAFVSNYFATLPADWKTWYEERIGNPGDPDGDAADKAAEHANTPAVAHFDSLGRPFLAVAHNRYRPAGADDGDPPTEEFYHTRTELDIEGNPREVVDAKDRVVMRYDYDMIGTRLHQASMEAGERWMAGDVGGNPIRRWDTRGHNFRSEYDELRRPERHYVRGTSDASDTRTRHDTNEVLFEQIEYGEAQLGAEQLNLRTRVYRQYDGAGTVTNTRYDFKGNLLESSREIQGDGIELLDWKTPPGAGEVFETASTYDALNRPVSATSPDGSIHLTTFNEANLLETVSVRLHGATDATPFVTNVDYNAKGQRLKIDYGNEVVTEYAYDPRTFRLVHIKSTRPANTNGLAVQIFKDSKIVQDLTHTYDPVGNITTIHDASLKVIHHNNEIVEPVNTYRYDSIYRLLEATGREHIGQAGFSFEPAGGNYRDYPFVGHVHPNDWQALRRYTESYFYDSVGNFERMAHSAGAGTWARDYFYEEDSLLEPGTPSNRLSRTTLGSDEFPYTHDAHGNMTSMPHLPLMQWDFRDQLRATAQQAVGNGGDSETTYYVYDSLGQRVRKGTFGYAAASNAAGRNKERLYLNGYEVYREYAGDDEAIALERQSLQVVDDKHSIAIVETRTIDAAGDDPAPGQLIRFQLANHLGSVGLELDADVQLISFEEFTPFGCASFQVRQTETPKRYRYAGQERDDESGLNYHSRRYYILWLGRWCRCDPSELVDGPNMYMYCRASPTVFVDESGCNYGTYSAGLQPSGRGASVEEVTRTLIEEVPPVFIEAFSPDAFDVSLASAFGGSLATPIPDEALVGPFVLSGLALNRVRRLPKVLDRFVDAAKEVAKAADNSARAVDDIADLTGDSIRVADDAGTVAGLGDEGIVSVAELVDELGGFSIYEVWNREWDAALRKGLSTGQENALTRYVDKLAKGETPSTSEVTRVWNYMRQSFVKQFDTNPIPPGHEIEHVNMKMAHPLDTLNPRNLFYVGGRESGVHESITEFKAAISGQFRNKWGAPNDPTMVIDVGTEDYVAYLVRLRAQLKPSAEGAPQ